MSLHFMKLNSGPIDDDLWTDSPVQKYRANHKREGTLGKFLKAPVPDSKDYSHLIAHNSTESVYCPTFSLGATIGKPCTLFM